jgi:hypothetical protein
VLAFHNYSKIPELINFKKGKVYFVSQVWGSEREEEEGAGVPSSLSRACPQ